jgi:hypothetical protein
MVDETIPRREFLKGAVVGTAALVTGRPAPAEAQAAPTAAPASVDSEPSRPAW